MKITKIHIENFGKLQNEDIEFKEGVNQVFHENSWGKSTLFAFINAMFYSMPARAKGELVNYERTRYMPWQGGKYGGYLEYETKDGKFRVTRYFEKTPEGDYYELKNLQDNKIITFESERLGESLFGLGKESFEVTAFFPQLKIASSSTPQITASLTGLDKFQNDLSSVKNALKVLDARIAREKKEKPSDEDISSYKKEIAENNKLIVEQTKKIEEIDLRIQEVKKAETLSEKLLSEEKEKNDTKIKAFNCKLDLQLKVTEENNKLNDLLMKANILKDSKIKENSTNKQKNKAIYVIPVIFLAIIALISVLAITDKITTLIAIVSVFASVLVCVLIEFLIVNTSRKKQENFATIKKIDADLKDCEKNVLISQKVLKSLYEQLEAYKDIENPDRQNMEMFESQVNTSKFERITIESERKKISDEIDDLIEANEKLRMDCDAIAEQISKHDSNIEILTKTRDLMLKAQENVSQRFIVPVNDELKKTLSRFSTIKQEFVIDTEWKVKENTNFGSKDFEYASQGLKDIISFCQRINLINKIYNKEKPFIMLDDTFVNLDDNKMKVAKELIKEMANDYQIIYVCCNSRCLL